ncbi:uncharacterized protein K02A2.6-like [Topomyia yanbarensis]|uniref:uncharacterized protein K02A2.6-like n=1 Tax=Topomyia yanbarensis TaxID=2498891 RepID=UPI00273CC2A1|nr:uncharacterized protein K02A2.6-like [Topomyia yanbarensis]XP_058839536.1 uncharacterized protein K02A2.6-like [Topomyia yanbarensis]
MQHYAVFLESFDYNIRYRSSKENANADAMSRLPIEDVHNKNRIEEVDIIELNLIETLPVTADELAEFTKNDPNVHNLLQGLKVGRMVDGRDRFGVDQNEFSVQKGCIMKGIRVYIPPKLRKRVLDELHMGHFGISRMKSLARSYCWWECVDRDIEDLSRDCCECASVRKNPPKVAIHCWEKPVEPFQRIHIDFAGPFLGLNFLVIMDAFTKWPEVKLIPDMTTDTTIDKLREYFVTYGVPSVIVSDRGVQFTSEQFQSFLNKNGVTHKMGAPYHPATNGLAERFVQTFKDKLKTLKCDRKDIQFELYKILLAYRRAVHPATGKSPSILVFGRQIKSRLDLIVPKNGEDKVEREEQGDVRCFAVNDRVAARDFLSSSKWKFGIVTERLGKLHYMIELDDGRIWKRHIDQLSSGPIERVFDADPYSINVEIYDHNRCENPIASPKRQLPTKQTDTPAAVKNKQAIPTTDNTAPVTQDAIESGVSDKENIKSRSRSECKANNGSTNSTVGTPRRSTRVRNPPKRLDI